MVQKSKNLNKQNPKIIKREKQVFGIKIISPFRKNDGFDKLRFNRVFHENYFGLVVAKGNWADPLFFTSPLIRTLIEKHSILPKSQIGYFWYEKEKHRGGLVLKDDINPFGEFKKKAIKEDFLKQGIASALEEKVLRELINKFGPNWRVEPFEKVSYLRKEQQLKRRIKVITNTPRYSIKPQGIIDRIREKRRKFRNAQRVRKR